MRFVHLSKGIRRVIQVPPQRHHASCRPFSSAPHRESVPCGIEERLFLKAMVSGRQTSCDRTSHGLRKAARRRREQNFTAAPTAVPTAGTQEVLENQPYRGSEGGRHNRAGGGAEEEGQRRRGQRRKRASSRGVYPADEQHHFALGLFGGPFGAQLSGGAAMVCFKHLGEFAGDADGRG